MRKKASTSRLKLEVVVTDRERRARIIDQFYVHCRYCNFFFERKFEGDDVCDAPNCLLRVQADKEEPI